jgi:hypothetical protein
VAVHGQRHAADLGTAVPDVGEEAGVFRRQREADGVGEVDDRRAGFDRNPADLGDEGGIGAGRVLARELDLVDDRRGVRNRPAGLLQDLLRLEAELLLHVERARREKDVDARAAGARQRLGCGVEVFTH